MVELPPPEILNPPSRLIDYFDPHPQVIELYYLKAWLELERQNLAFYTGTAVWFRSK